MIHQLPLRRISLSLGLFAVLCGCGKKESANDPLPTTPVERPGGSTRVERPGLIDTSTPANTTETTPVAGTTPTPTEPTTNTGTTPTTPVKPIETVPNTLKSVPAFGSDTTFEVATWNIEFYPKASQSKDQVSSVLKKLDIDLMAVNEILDEAALSDLASTLPGYGSILSTEKSDDETAQNAGFLYKKSVMEIAESEALFPGERFAFPRQPLKVRFKMKDGSADLVAIVVHLKAFGDEKSQTRREMANRILEEFVSGMRKLDSQVRVVIMGDFNDRVDSLETRNVFSPWLNDSYIFTTEPLAARGDYSFISNTYTSVIDHIIASSNLPLEEPQIPKLHTLIPNYEGLISDHLPVMTRLR